MRTEDGTLRGPGRTSPRGRSRGFTLLEVLAVMIIIAIGFLALRPGIVNVRRSAENRTAIRQLVGLLTSARTDAVAKGRLVRVMHDSAAGVFWAEAQVDPAFDRSEFGVLRLLGREQVRLPEWLILTDLVIAGQRTGDRVSDPIYFYPDGHADGVVLLLLDAKNGRELAVKVAPATGRVTVSV